ncbi:MAG: nicotinic acid mononucleotide adenylyltransferase, partial [Erythrobacter sp.]|nr:nicotinic acid mononucleotide adenylyltransferase [Erythrobacter sp.]
RFDPDYRSATAIRRANAGWAEALLGEQGQHATVRDRLTFRSIRSEETA